MLPHLTINCGSALHEARRQTEGVTMLAYLRLIALGLMLAATPALTHVAWADNHNQDRLPPWLLQDVNKLKPKVRGLKDKALRHFLKDLRRARQKGGDTAMIDDRIRLFEAELQRRQSAGANDQQRAELSKQERRARQLLQQAGPSNQLNAKALQKRIKLMNTYAKHPKVHDDTRESLLQVVRQDRRELKQRQAATQQPAISREERLAAELLQVAKPSADLRTPALRERIRVTRSLLDSKALQRETRQNLKILLAEDRREFKGRQQADDVSAAEKQARRFLKRAGPSRDLDRRALRERIQQTEGFLSQSGVSGQTRDKLAELRRSDRRELQQRRDDSQTQVSADEERARRLVNNARDGRRLDDQRLDDRIRMTRDLLAGAALAAATRASLEELLQRDRQERRSRRQAGGGSGGVDDAEDTARRLLRDDRAAQSLSDRELRARLRETRDVLQVAGLSERTSRAPAPEPAGRPPRVARPHRGTPVRRDSGCSRAAA